MSITCSPKLLLNFYFIFILTIPKIYSQNDCLKYGAFYGSPDGNERAKSILPTPADDALYAVGIKEDSTLIMKVSLTGEILWSRTFDIVPNKIDNVTTAILDEDGMIVTLGIAGDYEDGGSAFAFRYDPELNQILWAKEYVSPTNRTYAFAIVQNPKGNYVMAWNPHPPLPATTNDDEIVEVSKTTGAIVADKDKIYDLGGSDAMGELIFYKNFIYGTGRYTDGDPNNKMRNTIVKFDPANLSEVWVKLGHVTSTGSARLYGRDLVIDQDQIYSTYQGDPSGSSTSNTKMYVQKTDLNGSLAWIKQYELPGNNDVSYQIIKSASGGFLLLAGTNAAPSQIVLLKIDDNGGLLWAKQFQYPSFVGSITIDRGNNQLQEIAGNIYLNATAINTDGTTDLMILRLNHNGEVDMPCVTSSSMDLSVNTLTNSIFYLAFPAGSDGHPVIHEENPAAHLTPVPHRPECIVADTIKQSIAATICQGQEFEGYHESGIYVDTFTTLAGCDSIRRLTLSVVDAIRDSITASICHGESYEGYEESGTYVDTFSTNIGCDSIRVLFLSVLPIMESHIEQTICSGDIYQGYDHTGIFRDTFPVNGECDSVRVLTLRAIECKEIVSYNLNACSSFMSNGSQMDYSEFTPEYPNPLDCGEISATIVYRDPPQMNKHSCTPGVNNSIAMCISSNPSCTYTAGDQASLIFEITITPDVDSVIQITGLDFFEKAPATYSWISGPSGPNNYPKFYGIRVLKNGTEIFRKKDIPTSQSWSAQSYDFVNNPAFRIAQAAVIRFELLPYCPVGNGASVSAWDLDDIKVSGGCWPTHVTEPAISGLVSAMDGRKIRNMEILLSSSPDFSNPVTTYSDNLGDYHFQSLNAGETYYLKGYKNDEWLNGVSTFDILRIQKHLLGIESFTHPDQYIAADVNRSGTVSTLDLLDLRKALLGLISAFPNNTSWRFGTFDFNDQWNEIQSVENIKNDMIINLNGIKVGDLNNDVVLNVSGDYLASRTNQVFELTYEDRQIDAGKEILVPIRSTRYLKLEGIQLALKANDLQLTDIYGKGIELGSENFRVVENGVIRISWSQAQAVAVSNNDELFILKFIAQRSGRLSEMLHLEELALQPEAYTDQELLSVELKNVSADDHSLSSISAVKIIPNPFRESTEIEVDMNQDGNVQVAFYNLSGQLIYKLEKQLPVGKQRISVGKQEFGSAAGIITCQVVCQTQVITEKLVMIR